jgi:hypothetical protein
LFLDTRDLYFCHRTNTVVDLCGVPKVRRAAARHRSVSKRWARYLVHYTVNCHIVLDAAQPSDLRLRARDLLPPGGRTAKDAVACW